MSKDKIFVKPANIVDKQKTYLGEPQMNIQIIKTYKESFSDVLLHKWEWMKVAFGPFFVLVLGALIVLFTYMSHGLPFGFNEAGQFSFTGEVSSLHIIALIAVCVAYFIGLFSLQINGFRYAILRDGGDRWITLNLNKRLVKLFLYTILYNLLSQIYGFIVGFILGVLHVILDNDIINAVLITFFVLFGIYLLFRIFLYPVLISIDQRAPLTSSWDLTKSNVLRLIAVSLLVGLTLLFIGVVFGVVTALLAYGVSLFTSLSLIIWVFFGFLMLFISWAVSSKMMGLVYQDLSEQRNP